MHPEQIKAEMRMAGTTPAMLAEELCVSRATVSMVVNGRGTSARIQKRISEITGKAVSVLWPPKPKLTLRRKKEVATA
jgi:lambda repressor-like predicted transcriptional regulator